MQTITGARRSLTEDIKARQQRYLFSMAVRTACFVGAIFASGWLRGALFVGALVLPYVAVVIANGGREPAGEPPRLATRVLPELAAPPGRQAPIRPETPAEPMRDGAG